LVGGARVGGQRDEQHEELDENRTKNGQIRTKSNEIEGEMMGER
jgi:hypothetical protein